MIAAGSSHELVDGREVNRAVMLEQSGRLLVQKKIRPHGEAEGPAEDIDATSRLELIATSIGVFAMPICKDLRDSQGIPWASIGPDFCLVPSMDGWTPRRLALVDEALAGWAADRAARADDREGLIELRSSILRILGTKASIAAGMDSNEDEEPRDYARRWKSLADLVAARERTLAEKAPERVRQLKQVAELWACTPDSGEIEQKAMLEVSGMKASRLSQLLALMEAHGLIKR